MMEQGGADRGGHRQAEQQDECGDDQEAVADGEQAGEEPDGESGADGLGQAAGPVDPAALQGAVSADGHLLAQHPDTGADHQWGEPDQHDPGSSSRLTAAPAIAAAAPAASNTPAMRQATCP